MSETQRLEVLTALLWNCLTLGHPGCFMKWGGDLETLSMRLLASVPEEAVSGLRVAIAWRTAWGEYSRARALGDGIPTVVLGRCSVVARANLAAVRTAVAIRVGDMDAAETTATDVVALADESGDAGLRGNARVCLATILKNRGRFPEALSLYTQAEALHQASGDLISMARDQLHRALVLNRLGWVREAATTLEGAHRRSCEISHLQLILRTRLGLGLVAVRCGEFDDARRWLLRGWLEARRLRMPRERALALEFLAEALILTGRVSPARRILALCRRTAERIAPEGDLVADCGIREALLALVVGDPVAARGAAETARRCTVKGGLPWEESQALRLEAAALYRLHCNGEARARLLVARDRLRAMNEQLEINLVDRWLEFLDGGGIGEEPPIHPAQPVTPAKRIEESAAEVAPVHSVEICSPTDRLPAHPAKISGAGPRRSPTAGVSEAWRRLGLVTRSPRMLALLKDAEMFAGSDSVVLLQGETGTGKELLAHGVHLLSGRRGPLVPVNIGALPPDLFEGELFGAEKGAYTGAGQARRGLAVAAHGGTLFLDEIGEVGPRGQVALLRFLDSGEVRPVGSTTIQHLRLGVVAATNRPLRELVRKNLFRPDLYHRLAQGVLELPPLRERPEDLPDLVESLWIRQSGRAELPVGLLSDDALGILRAYSWPGNVRELDHYLRRVRISLEHAGETRVTLQQLQERLGSRVARPVTVSRAKDRAVINVRVAPGVPPDEIQFRQAMRAAGGNRSRAARILGIHRGSFYRLIERWGVSETRPAGDGVVGDA